MKNSNSSIRLEEIRKKYDTPTKRSRKENYSRSSFVENESASKENVSRDSILMNKDNHKEVLMQREFNTDNIKSSISKSFIDDKYSVKSKMTASITTNQQNKELNHYDRQDRNDRNEQSRYEINRERSQHKNEEEQVFKKIKEMKQSLMGKSAYDKIRPTRSIIDPREQIESQQKSSGGQGQRNQGYRIDNIDKINSKIQQILNCLKENQNRPKFCEDVENEKQKDFTVPKTELSSKTNFTNYDKEKSQVQQRPSRQSFFIRQSDSIYQEEKIKKQPLTPQQTVTGFKYSDNKKDVSRARSFISSVQKEAGNSYKLNSGKKLDDEISKIQNKIKHFEQQKRKLNIQFTPFNYTRSKSSADLTYRAHAVNKDKKVEGITKPTDYAVSSSKVNSTVEERINNRHKRLSSQIPEGRQSENIQRKSVEDNKFQVQLNSQYNSTCSKGYQSQCKQPKDSFEIKLIPVTVVKKQSSPKSQSNTLDKSNQDWQSYKDAQNDKQDDTSSLQYQKFRNKIKQQTQQGIQGRKKKLSQCDKNKPAAETKRLTNALCQQVKLDEQFRNNKILFDNCINKKKWQKLEESLQNNSLTLSKEQMNSIFKLTDEENNPFFSLSNTARQQNQDLQSVLIRSYQQSDQHWKRQVSKKFNKNKLLQEYFCKQKIDLERKGYLVMQDLVRFLNIETGTFYRNRDMYLIFKRISPKEQIDFDELIRALTQN